MSVVFAKFLMVNSVFLCDDINYMWQSECSSETSLHLKFVVIDEWLMMY